MIIHGILALSTTPAYRHISTIPGALELGRNRVRWHHLVLRRMRLPTHPVWARHGHLVRYPPKLRQSAPLSLWGSTHKPCYLIRIAVPGIGCLARMASSRRQRHERCSSSFFCSGSSCTPTPSACTMSSTSSWSCSCSKISRSCTENCRKKSLCWTRNTNGSWRANRRGRPMHGLRRRTRTRSCNGGHSWRSSSRSSLHTAETCSTPMSRTSPMSCCSAWPTWSRSCGCGSRRARGRTLRGSHCRTVGTTSL
mmetsp:Transcript_63669/g.113671  ORF Transcript_63669/g.113671 Transcript_63669/m.113671 type:complete len:252 (+) Transcript_63669:467-1222(+)